MVDITTEIIKKFLNDKLNYSTLTILDEIYTNLDPNEQKKLDNILVHHNKLDTLKVNLDVVLTNNIKEDAFQVIKTDNNRKCIAITPRGKPCIRYKTEGSDYCGIHIKNKDIIENTVTQPVKRQRGRKTNVKGPDTSEVAEYDTSLYIQTITMNIENVDYLVDAHGIVFSNDRENLIVGYIADDTVHWIS